MSGKSRAYLHILGIHHIPLLTTSNKFSYEKAGHFWLAIYDSRYLNYIVR